MFVFHSLCFILCFSLCSADEDDGVTAEPASHFIPSDELGSARSLCKPVPSTMSLCSGIGYREMRVPNLLGHDSAREAQQQSAAWIPLLGKRCHPDARRFLCSLFAPVCLPELAAPVRPCRSVCAAVRDACLPVMSAFGFPWPETFDCSRFPDGPELCVPGGAEPNRPDDTSRGSVICQACVSGSEGEKEVQQNFCKSQFAFRLRISSSSLGGSDMRVVPQGRSRVLRWEGSESEQQADMQHSALWLPEAESCSCPALDGQLTGSFIALGHVQNGRMVLSKLLKWTQREKELKQFIKTLLRQNC